MFFRKKKTIGLALGGGAAKGLAHIGVLRVLEEIGLKPDIITGTSFGALIGAMYASGRTADEIERIADSIDRKEALKLFSISLNGAGFIDGKKITQFLSTVIKRNLIEDMDIPFACTACNIIDGTEIIFDKGNIIESVRASISIPGIFSPVDSGELALVDGGLVNPVPVDIAREMGADFIIAVNVLNVPRIKHGSMTITAVHTNEPIDHNLSVNERLKVFIENEINTIESMAKRVASIFDLSDEMNIFDVMSQTMHLAERNIAEYKLISDKPDILIEPDMEIIKHFEFHKTKEAAALGENEARKYIDLLKKLI